MSVEPQAMISEMVLLLYVGIGHFFSIQFYEIILGNTEQLPLMSRGSVDLA